ncbi:MAG: xanthine dehydrogenase family protein subunit M [Acidobacteriota bacterium]|jgi:xanthine dehydrogenase YagS FAD-binding subunit
MNNFEYASPETVDSAVQLLGSGAVVLAGGTDLLSLMKDGVATPNRLVNIKSIPELRGIEDKGADGIRIGALVTLDELMHNPLITEGYPALVQVAEGVRSPQLENMGTVGGDLCQRPRCWYYRHGFGLLAMRDGKSMVVDGNNRYHAILGNAGPAYFVSPSSLAPALIAYGAKVGIQGSGGARQVAVADFYKVPTAEGQREYDLADNEVLTEIVIPPASDRKTGVYEVREREAMDWPLVVAVASLEMDGNTVKSADVVLGQVAPKPWPVPAAGQALSGKPVSVETAEAAGKAAVQGARPLSENGYKVTLARVAVKRAVLRAAGMEVT